MKYIVSYSGGLGSFMAAYLTVQKQGKENVTLFFTDTRTEDEDLYRFVQETQKALDVPLVTAADGRNVWEVFTDVKFMGNSRIDPCSKILKRELAKKWFKENHKPEETTIVFGIGHNEGHRMTSIKANWQPYNTWAPLTELKKTREEILDVLETLKIEPPRLYEMGFKHNNCGGFCVKAGQKQFLNLYQKMPERYRWHEEQQEKLFVLLGKRHGFLKKSVNGEIQYLGLKEFREIIESGGQIDMYTKDGCGCFV